MMARTQADGYFAVLPYPDGLNKLSRREAAQTIAALDWACHPDEAERLLRVFWDKPVPAPLASLAQADSGEWKDAAGTPDAHACTMEALARHALVTGDRDWAQRAWPALKAGAAWLTRADAAATADQAEANAIALLGAAEVAAMLHLSEAAPLRARARDLSPGVIWAWTETGHTGSLAPAASPPVSNQGILPETGHTGSLALAAPVELTRLRNALMTERRSEQGDALLVYPVAGIAATALPTEFGPCTLKVEQTPNSLIVNVNLTARREPGALVVFAPLRDGRPTSRVELDGRPAVIDCAQGLGITPASGAHVVTFFY